MPEKDSGAMEPSGLRVAPESVETSLKYLVSAEEVPVYVASVGGGDTSLHQGNYVRQRVMIRNGRIRPEGSTLDRKGFLLAEHASAVRDFYDDDEIAAVYEVEVAALVRRATGAVRVEIFDHTRRAASGEVQKERLIREPASIVHNDYTARSGPKRLRDHFDRDEADVLLRRRFAIVNVWRSIRGTVRTAPIALCDASSVVPRDLVSVKREARDRIGEIQQAVYNPAHRWYYFPAMQPAEVLLINTYDSAIGGPARSPPPASSEPPPAAVDAEARESLETRCFAFF